MTPRTALGRADLRNQAAAAAANQAMTTHSLHNQGSTAAAASQGSKLPPINKGGGGGAGLNSLVTGLGNLSVSSAASSRRGAANSGGGSEPTAAAAAGPCRTMEDVARGLRAGLFRRVVVVTGAGTSTPSGIPDFRTKGSGLYDNLQQYNIPYPEAIFDLDYFRRRPHAFYSLARELYPSGRYRPNVCHYLTRLLHDKGLLLRCYTQNIDGLETLAGVPDKQLVEAHGTFSSASCVKCGRPFPSLQMRDAIFSGTVARCRHCQALVKPDITFFGEELPDRFYLFKRDLPAADLVLVMGTSLAVEPFADIVKLSRREVPRVLINRAKVGPFRSGPFRPSDIACVGELEPSVWKLLDLVNWTREMRQLMAQHENTLPPRQPLPPPPKPPPAGKQPPATRPPAPTRRTNPPSRPAPRTRRGPPSSSSSSEDASSSSDSD